MKRSKFAGLVMAALVSLAVMATNALAAVNLPDISIALAGGTYPVHFQGTLPNVGVLIETSSGLLFTGAGVTLLLLSTELSALGTFTTDITDVIYPGNDNEECGSPGDVDGVALVNGNFSLVPTNLSPLSLGLLLTVTPFEIQCPLGPIIIVKGNVLGSVNGIGSEATELTGFGARFEGHNGEQYISEYYNDGGTKVRTELEAESGAGFVQADEELEMVMNLSVLGSKMITITGR